MVLALHSDDGLLDGFGRVSCAPLAQRLEEADPRQLPDIAGPVC